MSRKLMVAFVLVMLGLASVDAMMEPSGGADDARATSAEGGLARPPL